MLQQGVVLSGKSIFSCNPSQSIQIAPLWNFAQLQPVPVDCKPQSHPHKDLPSSVPPIRPSRSSRNPPGRSACCCPTPGASSLSNASACGSFASSGERCLVSVIFANTIHKQLNQQSLNIVSVGSAHDSDSVIRFTDDQPSRIGLLGMNR